MPHLSAVSGGGAFFAIAWVHGRSQCTDCVCLPCVLYEYMSSREVLRLLLRAGWFEIAQVGSHKQLKHGTWPGRVTVPHPKRDLPIGTLKSIEKQAGLKLT